MWLDALAAGRVFMPDMPVYSVMDIHKGGTDYTVWEETPSPGRRPIWIGFDVSGPNIVRNASFPCRRQFSPCGQRTVAGMADVCSMVKKNLLS